MKIKSFLINPKNKGFLIISAILLILCLLVFRINKINNSIDVDFGSCVVAKNNVYQQTLSPVTLKGVKKAYFDLGKMKIERIIQGKVTIGSQSYKISDCIMMGDRSKAHYLGTLSDEKLSFVLDENLTLISFIDFKNDTRINAPARTILEFKALDERVIDLF